MSDDGLHDNYAERELDEPVCDRCEAPESWCRCLPIVACPQCGEEQEDADGFGVLHCEDCGFCTHASMTGDVCFLCKRRVSDAA